MPFEGAAYWGQSGMDDRRVRDEERVRREFWSKMKRLAASLPFAEDLLAAYYCAFDHATPVQVKATLVGALAYLVCRLLLEKKKNRNNDTPHIIHAHSDT